MNPGVPRILIIDDEQTICDACYQIFTDLNYRVEVCNNGEEGLKKIDEFKPDIVFVDLKMPGISGMEVLGSIAEKKLNTIPIVITGYASIESAVESMKKGAFDFLPKPFTADELTVITERALEKKRLLDEKNRVENEKEIMRQNFISLVSHELRTPLVAVMQYLEVLSGGMAGQVSEQQKNIINRMKIRMSELLNLINRWLKLARIEELNLKENFEGFPLEQIVDESIDLLKPLAEEKGITIEKSPVDAGSIVRGDRELIKEVFVNIITNGIKYNQQKGKIIISYRRNCDYAAVDITDTGIGIGEEDMSKIGEEFYRARREGVASGSGLGLAIVKKILDVHNGRLEMKSKLNEGSTFSVYLPLVSLSLNKGNSKVKE